MIVLSFITNFFARFFPVAITIILCILCPYKRHVSRTGLLLPKQQFQSTHLVWDATSSSAKPLYRRQHFNPRTSYEMRPVVFKTHFLIACISIHAPRMRCDIRWLFERSLLYYFNPRTSYEMRLCDSVQTPYNHSDFNPRTSYEMRLTKNKIKKAHALFQSTHLVWDATLAGSLIEANKAISIHAPRMRCDREMRDRVSITTNFNPRTSYEMRLAWICDVRDH